MDHQKLSESNKCGRNAAIEWYSRAPIQDLIDLAGSNLQHGETLTDLVTANDSNWETDMLKRQLESCRNQDSQLLPEDLRESVGYIDDSDNSMTITVAGAPIGSGERDRTQTHLSRVLIRYRASIWDQGRVVTEEEVMDQNVDIWPVVSVRAEDALDKFREEYEIGRDSVKSFKRGVRRAILETMWSGGGYSMVQKTANGRFVRSGGLTAFRFEVVDDTLRAVNDGRCNGIR